MPEAGVRAVMVGEIRDYETEKRVPVRGAHRSCGGGTLHTNDAPFNHPLPLELGDSSFLNHSTLNRNNRSAAGSARWSFCGQAVMSRFARGVCSGEGAGVIWVPRGVTGKIHNGERQREMPVDRLTCRPEPNKSG